MRIFSAKGFDSHMSERWKELKKWIFIVDENGN